MLSVKNDSKDANRKVYTDTDSYHKVKIIPMGQVLLK